MQEDTKKKILLNQLTNQPEDVPELEEEGDVDEKPFAFFMTPPGNVSVAFTQQDATQGEEEVSGSTAALESDDDTLDNAHAVGLQLDDDEEHPHELDLAGDINKAEEYHRTH